MRTPFSDATNVAAHAAHAPALAKAGTSVAPHQDVEETIKQVKVRMNMRREATALSRAAVAE